MKQRLIQIGLVLLGVLVALVLVELFLRYVQPPEVRVDRIYNVLYLEPDPLVGWKHPANFDFQWRGFSNGCVEFDVPVSMNSYGFRDTAWSLEKPDNLVRIALLGDSHIEALQVPHEETAGQVLQQKLNASPLAAAGTQFEVMNFGVSNYSVSQYQLVYDAYARQFQPDYVVIYVAYFHMVRSTLRVPGLGPNYPQLEIRPTYTLDDEGELRFLPATDYDAYVSAVRESIQTIFGDDRSVESLPDDIQLTGIRIIDLLRNAPSSRYYNAQVHPNPQDPDPDQPFDALELNYEIMRLLNEQVTADGGQLILVDAFDYWETYTGTPGSGVLVDQNRAFADEWGIGYIELSERFRAADAHVRFPCDGHLTPLGNQLLADALFEWFNVNHP